MTDHGFLTYETDGRVLSLDRLRGLSLALMLAFGTSKQFACVPYFVPFNTHDLSVAWQLVTGYGFYDVIAPLFVFASGLAFVLSYRVSCRRLGRKRAVRRCIKHGWQIIGLGGLLLWNLTDAVGICFFVLMMIYVIALAVAMLYPKLKGTILAVAERVLIGIGVILTLLNVVETVCFVVGVTYGTGHWGPLASIGLAMLVCVAFVDTPPKWRAVLSMCYVAAYWCLSRLLSLSSGGFSHGGLLGSFGYALLFLLAGTVYELRPHRFFCTVYCLALYALALATAFYMAPSKGVANCSYILMSFAIDYVLLLFWERMDGIRPRRVRVLETLGVNSLTCYCLHFVITPLYGICLNALVTAIPVPSTPLWDGARALLLAGAMVLYVVLVHLLLRTLRAKGCVIRLR